MNKRMKKKKTLWNGVSVLIVTVLAIMAFTRGYVQLGLTTVAFIAWSIWASVRFLVPFISTKLEAREAKKIRQHYEEEERKMNTTESDGTGIVLLRHVNHRITAHLQTAYPGATWEWRVDDPESLVAKGGTGRIQVFGIADFNYADVSVNTNAEINCEMLKIVPMSEIHREAVSEEVEVEPMETPKTPQNPINPQIWYEQKGRVVLENLITDLSSRGHSSLSITENGDVIVKQADKEIRKTTLEAMPDKVYWHRLAKVFQSEGLAADVTDNAVVLSW